MTFPPLTSLLQQAIKEKQGLSVAEYMEVCLSHPQYGYYHSQDPYQDFTTAPEVSQLFGEMIGAWCIDLWSRCDDKMPVHLIELGPGRGTLLQDFLRHVPRELRSRLSLHLVESNPILRKYQQEALKSYSPTWYSTFEEACQACAEGNVIVLANEFFDALPIFQFVKDDQGWQERIVSWDTLTQDFTFSHRRVTPPLHSILQNYNHFKPGQYVEICPQAIKAVQYLGQFFKERRGALLLIDYGYTSPPALETLQAIYRHQPTSIFKAPGQADLTAHVNFSALKHVGEKAGLTVYGPIGQGIFLQELGILQRAQLLLQKADVAQTRQIHEALQKLLGPSQMGALFKVMALTSLHFPLPTGFSQCLPSRISAA